MRKIVFFQVHPDDLEFNCYHLIYYLKNSSKNKYEVKIASLSRGEYGWPKHAKHFRGERLGKLRTKELYKAMSVYGIPPQDIHFFEIIDGYIHFNKRIVGLVKEYLNQEEPDIIISCEPRNTYYRHPDHMNIGKILYYILDKGFIEGKPKLYFYNSINPNFFWPIKKVDISSAYQTMHLHKSQMHIWKVTRRLYTLMIRAYGSGIEGWKYAEGYRRVYYGEERHKNKKLKFLGRLFLTLNVKSWPEKITRH
jgi:LmbE family N-acetylglucosaminyl deacetylase